MPRRVLNRVVLLALLGLFTTVVIAALLALLADVRQGPATQSSGYDLKGRWTVSRWDRAGAVQIHFSRARGANWGPEQATGEPDSSPGDVVTAWASQSPDGGGEWLVLGFADPLVRGELRVYENNAPGALVR